jgi:ADP-heptose:LPS heptosyltransferase
MRLGFPLRRVSTKLEFIARRIAVYKWYCTWMLFNLRKYKKQPGNIRKITVIDCSGGLGDNLGGIGVLNSLKKQYSGLEIFYITNDAASKTIYSNSAKIMGESYFNKELLKNSDIIIEISPFRNKTNNQYLKQYYVVGMGPYSIKESLTDVFARNKLFSYNKTFPAGINHAIRERFMIFEKSGFYFPDYRLYFESSEQHKKEAKKIHDSLKLKNKKIVFFNPFSGTSKNARAKGLIPSHDWPLENYSSLANMILADKNSRIIVLGLKQDEEEAGQIISSVKKEFRSRICSLCGKISFFGLGELMKKGKCIVSLDTSCAHLAAQVGLPVIDLMGPFNPKIWAAWQPKEKGFTLFHKEVCNSCRRFYCPERNNICMKTIFVEEVHELIKTI